MSTSEKPKPSLILSVKAENWRMDDPWSEGGDQEFKRVRGEVLNRDNFTCQACGFKASKWQEVHHLDDNHHNNAKENLVTLCSFCHMVQHIGFAGMNGEAKLVWLPEISQAQLHHIIRAILVAEYELKIAGPSPSSLIRTSASAAASLKAHFLAREQGAKDRIGTSNPSVLGEVLTRIAKTNPGLYNEREKFLAGIRLLPTGVRMGANGENIMQTQIIPFWISNEKQGPFAAFRVASWRKLLSTKIP